MNSMSYDLSQRMNNARFVIIICTFNLSSQKQKKVFIQDPKLSVKTQYRYANLMRILKIQQMIAKQVGRSVIWTVFLAQKLVYLDYVDQRVLKILYKLYRFCKMRNMIEKYFECRYIPRVISYSLQAAAQIGGQEQMFDFVRDLLYFIRYTQSTSSIQSICSEFQTFLENYLLRAKPQHLVKMMVFLQNQEKSQPYVASFYYAYVLSTLSNEERYTYIIKIFSLIQFLPLKIITFFQSSLYSFILYKDSCFLEMILNKTANNQPSHINKRKIQQIKRTMIKIVHNIQNIHYNRQKPYKNQIRAHRILLLKCRNVGSYVLPQYSNITLYLKPTFL